MLNDFDLFIRQILQADSDSGASLGYAEREALGAVSDHDDVHHTFVFSVKILLFYLFYF